ncbi:MAG: P27 family phage terminase small subunit [Pseudomonadota bacterium]
MSVQTPSHLSKEGKSLWRDILSDFELIDTHQLRLLESLCCVWSRILEARAAVEEKGAYLPNRFGELREHPALKVEVQNRKLFAQLVRELGLNLEAPAETPRRPRTY